MDVVSTCMRSPAGLSGKLTCNQGVLGSSRTGASGYFAEVSLGKTLQSPSLVLMKPGKDISTVSCRRKLKAA